MLRTAAEASIALTPAPIGTTWLTLGDELGSDRDNWDLVPREGRWREHGDEAAELTRRAFEICTGNTLVHCDLRDDNVIIDETGDVWFCDWNFPVTGPVWVDTVSLIISMHGDGLDGDALLAASPVVRPGDAEAIDSFLALMAGYHLRAGSQPEVVTSPHLRSHQRWYARVIGDWLAARRGWSDGP